MIFNTQTCRYSVHRTTMSYLHINHLHINFFLSHIFAYLISYVFNNNSCFNLIQNCYYTRLVFIFTSFTFKYVQLPCHVVLEQRTHHSSRKAQPLIKELPKQYNRPLLHKSSLMYQEMCKFFSLKSF